MKRACLANYHRAIIHLWAVLTAPRREPVSLTALCKLHGVSTNLPATLRRMGYLEGSRRSPLWVGVPLDGVPTEAFARRVMEVTLESMRDPAPVPAPPPAPPADRTPTPVQLRLDPDADVREQLAALTSVVQALVDQGRAAA